jgi:peptidoglycan/LPS O-acetylase OafA/YrhL
MEPEVRKAPIRFYEIDLLRFLAAIFVVFNHYTWRLNAGDEHISTVSFPEFAGVTKYGLLGVNLFFIISGYVVLMSAQGKTVRQFFISRVTRLYPAFWAACTLSFVVMRLFGPPPTAPSFSWFNRTLGDYFVSMTMFQGFVGRLPIDGVYWTLTIELMFYIFIAMLVGFKLLPHLNVVCLLWMIYVAAVGPTPGVETPLYFFLIGQYAPYFIAGMLFYLIQNKQGKRWQLYSLLFFAYVLALRQSKGEMGALSLAVHEHMSGLVAMVASTVFFGIFYLVITRTINLQKAKWLSIPGSLTYPLYVIHAVIGYIVFQRFGDSVNKYILLVLLLLAMIAIAWLIHILVERKLSYPLGQAVNRLLTRLERV